MINRENGLVELYNRVVSAKDTLGLKAIKRSPTAPISETYLPCVFIHEDVDEIVKPASRSQTGYPCTRVLEVTFEMITGKSDDVKQLYRSVRSVIFSEGTALAERSSFIREIRTEGPTGYGLPDVLGIRLIIALTYTDDGT